MSKTTSYWEEKLRSRIFYVRLIVPCSRLLLSFSSSYVLILILLHVPFLLFTSASPLIFFALSSDDRLLSCVRTSFFPNITSYVLFFFDHFSTICLKKPLFSTMLKRGVWRHEKKVSIPDNRRLVGSRWVFK